MLISRAAPLILIFCFICTFAAFSQKSTFVGINFTFESTSGTLRPGIGATGERQITHHSGIETGLYYRNYVHSQFVTFPVPGGGLMPATFIISERQLSIPVLYKYYSRIVNASIGPTFDFYLGWRQKNKTSTVTVNDYSVDPNFSPGLMVKVSKSIPLTFRVSLEPELRYNLYFVSEREFAGFAVAAKYKLR